MMNRLTKTQYPAAAALAVAAVLFLAPLLLGLTGQAAVAAYLLGLVGGGAAVKALARPDPRDPWLLVGTGAVTILAPLVLGFIGAGWAHVVLGLALAATGGWALRPGTRSEEESGAALDAMAGEGTIGNR
jgi:hypothetical protein